AGRQAVRPLPRRHRPRSDPGQALHRAARRTHLARERGGQGDNVHVRATSAGTQGGIRMTALMSRIEAVVAGRTWIIFALAVLIAIPTLVLGEVAANDTRQRVRE